MLKYCLTAKIFAWSLILFPLLSCNGVDRQKTLLDFEFGMNFQEFNSHANTLENSGIIKNRYKNSFEYAMNLGNEWVFFKCDASVYGNSRLRGIRCATNYAVTKEQRDLIIRMLKSKYGNPSYPFQVNPGAREVSNVQWHFPNHEINLTIGNDLPTHQFVMEYAASGQLYDNLVRKDKSENGVIDVNNRY